ncbi:MAG: hypothetical protein V4502_13175, partial [Pseudomonadota bacterium]
RRSWILIIPILSACGEAAPVRAAHEAEQRLIILEATSPTDAELCGAKRAVAAAWLNALDKEKYEMAKITADIACVNAQYRG